MKKGKKILPTKQSDRKTSIITAATSIFAKKGYERTTLKDIAAEVGISKATLYYYYGSKHILFFDIVHKNITDAIEGLNQIVNSSRPTKEKIDLSFRQHFKFYIADYPGPSVMLHEKTNVFPQDLEIRVKNKFREYITLWDNVLKEGVDSGIIRSDLDIKVMRWAAIGMCNWVYKWADLNGRLEFNQISEIFSKLYTEGILAK